MERRSVSSSGELYFLPCMRIHDAKEGGPEGGALERALEEEERSAAASSRVRERGAMSVARDKTRQDKQDQTRQDKTRHCTAECLGGALLHTGSQ